MKPPKSTNKQFSSGHRSLHVVPLMESGQVLELLRPGAFVTLDNQPDDLPPFQVIRCKGGLCSVRQQSWGKCVRWEVEHRRLKSA